MRRVLALALAGVALVLSGPAGSAPSWGAPVQVSTGDRALGPELSVSTSGESLVVWDQEVGSDCATVPAALSCIHIVEAASRSAGSETWGAPKEISRPGVGSTPRAAVDASGAAAILWVHDIGRDRVLQASYRKGSSGAFPEPNDISEPRLAVTSHHVALDGAGNVVTVWAERPSTTFVVRSATRSALTGAWSSAVTLSRPGADVSAGPALAMTPDGVAVAAWVEDGAVRASRSLIGSSTGSWESPVTLSTAASVAQGAPSVALDPTGDAVVVWPSQTGPATAVASAFRSASAGSWASPVTLGARLTTSAAPAASLAPDGTALAVWIDARGVESTTRSPATGVWSQPAPVSAVGAVPTDLRLSADGAGNAVAAWVSVADVVQAALRPGASGAWLPPRTVSSAGVSLPSVALDAAGAAVSTWNRTAGQQVVVESAELTGAGPILDRLVAPPLAVAAGTRTRFSVRVIPWASALAGASTWKFGDGASATGTSVSHVYRRGGRFTVALSASDTAGGTSEATASVVIVAVRPRNTRPPSLRGTPRVGRTLTCVPGLWAGSPPIRFAYRWVRDGRFLTGATTPRRHLAVRDAGLLIACEVVASNATGSARASSAAVAVRR